MAWPVVFASLLTAGGILILSYDDTRPEDLKCGVMEYPNFEGQLVYKTPGPIKFNLYEGTSRANRTLSLSCTFEVYNRSTTEVEWFLKRNDTDIQVLKGSTTIIKMNNRTQLVSIYKAEMSSHLFDAQNGSYTCRVWDSFRSHYLTGQIDVLLYVRPEVKIEFARALSPSEIYLNWTLKAFNSHIQGLYLFVVHNATYSSSLNIPLDDKKFYIVSGLSSNTTYELVLTADTTANINGKEKLEHAYGSNVIRTTLPKDLSLQPTIWVRSVKAKSVEIQLLQLSASPSNVADYVHFYELQLRKGDNSGNTTTTVYTKHDSKVSYIFNNLDPDSTYVITARACFFYGVTRCGIWSEEMKGETISAIPGKPTDVRIDCNTSKRGYIMNLTWGPPKKPVEIYQYKMEIKSKGKSERTRTKLMNNDTFTASTVVSPNRDYMVRLKAVSPQLEDGQEELVHCRTRERTNSPEVTFWRRLRRLDKISNKKGNPFQSHKKLMDFMIETTTSEEYDSHEDDSIELL